MIEFVPKNATKHPVKRINGDASSPIPTHDLRFTKALRHELESAQVFTTDANCPLLNAENLLRHVQALHRDLDLAWLHEAMQSILKQPLRISNDGEMILQQHPYSPFAHLFHSVNTNGCLADPA